MLLYVSQCCVIWHALFIYLFISANPDNLLGNLKYNYSILSNRFSYIKKYVRKSALLGKNGYTLTNLEAVV